MNNIGLNCPGPLIFSVVNAVILHDPELVVSSVDELQMQRNHGYARLNINYIRIFECGEGRVNCIYKQAKL